VVLVAADRAYKMIQRFTGAGGVVFQRKTIAWRYFFATAAGRTTLVSFYKSYASLFVLQSILWSQCGRKTCLLLPLLKYDRK